MHICHSASAKDANLNQALCDRFGGGICSGFEPAINREAGEAKQSVDANMA